MLWRLHGLSACRGFHNFTSIELDGACTKKNSTCQYGLVGVRSAKTPDDNSLITAYTLELYPGYQIDGIARPRALSALIASPNIAMS